MVITVQDKAFLILTVILIFATAPKKRYALTTSFRLGMSFLSSVKIPIFRV